MTSKSIAILIACFAGSVGSTKEKVLPDSVSCSKIIATVRTPENVMLSYLQIPCVYTEGWDTLAEVKFWRSIITLSKDSSMANVYGTRQLLRTVGRNTVDSMERLGKLDVLRAEFCKEFSLPADTRIKFTGGKKWFYQQYDGINSKLARAIKLFDSFGADPFYAQCVLLIESPGSNKAKSSSGAYGQFQLMPFVARQYGLRVDKYVDERENFDRSAYAAARLFKEICVPYAKKWCEVCGYEVDEKAIWFKLLALHCYNAGSSNVKRAMVCVSREHKGIELIKHLWHTYAGGFQTESQNYSQIALACYLEFENHVKPFSPVSSVVYDRF
jgi:Transglycosylase SLT domain